MDGRGDRDAAVVRPRKRRFPPPAGQKGKGSFQIVGRGAEFLETPRGKEAVDRRSVGYEGGVGLPDDAGRPRRGYLREEFRFHDLAPRKKPGPRAPVRSAPESCDPPLFPHPYGRVPSRGVREEDQGGQRFLLPVIGEGGSKREGQDHVPVHGDERASLQKLPGVPDTSPRAENDRLNREIDADGPSPPTRHGLPDEFRLRVEVHDERFDPRSAQEFHVVGAQGSAQDRDDGLGQLVGKRAKAGPQPGGENHPPQGDASEAALPASSERTGRSLRPSGFIRGFRSKFAER